MLRRPSRALGCAVAAAIATFALASAAQPDQQPAPLPPPGEPAAPQQPTLPPASPPTAQPAVPAAPPSFPPPSPTAVTKPGVLPDYPNFGPATPGVPKQRANPTMMHWGIAMTTGGLLVTIAGAIITASSIDVVDIYCDGPAVCLHRDDTVKKGIGSTMLVGGAVVGAIGFPLWLFGGRMVPVKRDAKTGSFAPEVRVGPASAHVSFAF